MAFTTSLLTSYLDDCNIKYQVEGGFVGFEYNQRLFFGAICSTPPFESCLSMVLPGLCEVSPFDVKTYLKFINQLNGDMDLVKFVFDEKDNSIYVEAFIPLDSSPEMDDLVPGLVNVLLAAHDRFVAAHQ